MKCKRLAVSLLVVGLSLVAASAHAEGLRFLPILDPGYTFEPALAVSAGVMNVPDADHDADLVYGLDVNFNCGLFQTPANRIRTHVQVNRTDHASWESLSFELSPRYTLPVGGVALGVGPVLALVLVDNGPADENLFGYGAVGGVEYRMGKLYAGLDLRYLNTTESNSVEFENWTVLAKVGVNF